MQEPTAQTPSAEKIKKVWNIQRPDRTRVEKLCEEFRFPELISSILLNRGIDTFEKIQQYTKPSTLNLTSPFYFRDMQKTVDRILAAVEKKQAILIFGDKDVDGVTATAILYKFLERLDANVVFRVPEGGEDYGLTKDVLRWASTNEISLIITVDCGITSIDEVDYANSIGIDVIITDHHEPREVLPKAFSIINPKIKEDHYPFRNLSGSSVSFKLVCGMMETLYLNDYHDEEIVVFDVETTGLNPTRDEIIEIGAVKVKNGVTIGQYQTLIKASVPVSAEITRITNITNEMLDKDGIAIADALRAFLDFAGNLKLVGHNSIEFDMKFIQQAAKKHLGIATLSNPVEDTLKMSHVMLKKLNSYGLNSVAQTLGVFVDTKILHRALADSTVCAEIYRRLIIGRTNRVMELYQELLPLAAVGTIADIMPLIDENRNIVKNGLRFIPHSSIGLIYLIREVNLSLDHVSSRDISWNISPLLNSPGRMGNASISVELLISNKIKETEELVKDIVRRDSARKNVMDDGVDLVNTMIDAASAARDKIIFISSKDFTRGTTGLLANRLAIEYRVPAMVISTDGEASSGSVRSVSGFNVVELLENMSDLLIQYGGHKAAGGFTMKTKDLPALKDKLLNYMKDVDLTKLQEEILIDGTIENMTDLNLNMVRYLNNVLEPMGNSNEIPRLLLKRLKITTHRAIGKDGSHTLMTVQKDGKDMTVVGWNWTEKLKPMLNGGAPQGQFDIVATPEINKFQGNEELRLNLIDIQPS